MAQQNVEVKIVGKDAASKEILGVGNALERMQVSVETNKKGLNKLDDALKNSATNMVGLQGTAGRLADALIEFAPGGLVGGAVIAGIVAIGYALSRQKERQEEIVKTGKDLSDALEQQRLAYIKASQGVDAYNEALLRSNITLAQTAVTEATSALVKFEEETRQAISGRVRGLQQLNRLAAGGEGAGRTPAEQVNAESVAISVRNERLAESNKLMTTLAEANARLSIAIAAQNQSQIEEAKRSQQAAAKAVTDAENARKKALQDSITEYQQLYNINKAGLPLTIEQQDKLNSRIDEYRNIVNDVTRSLEERQLALNAVNQLESDIEKRRTEIARAQKERDDEQKRILKEREELQKKTFEDAIKSQEQYLNNIRTSAMFAADAFNLMFSVIGQGGNALKTLGQGFAQLVSGLARSKAAENIAYAVENIAKAFGNTAIGNFAGAALNKSAAAGHFKAAALWGTLAGVSAAASSTGGSRGVANTGGGFNNSNLGQVGSGTSPIYITITGGGLLDMNNPETARSFVNAINVATNRRAIIQTTGRP